MYKKFGGGGGFKKFNQGADRPMHDAVCSECGSPCQVPFRPNGTRPVLCRNCFKKDEGGAGGFGESRGFTKRPFEKRPFKKFGSDRGGERDGGDRLKFIEMKLDKILALLEDLDDDA